MSTILTLGAVLAALLLGAMSPGPSFVFVVRTSLSSARSAGAAAAAGMGLGGFVYGLLALLGLRSVLERVPSLYVALRVAGGLYLLVLAVRMWRGASLPGPLVDQSPLPPKGLARTLFLALGTQLSNPKTALVYASIFAAALPSRPSTSVLVALPPLIFLVEAGWYLVVAVGFSSNRPRAAYLRFKKWVDRTGAGVMGALGVSLLWRQAKLT